MSSPLGIPLTDLHEGDQAEQRSFGPVTRTDIVRYAGASGDFTPIHHDEELAHRVGLPSVFAMGMMHGGMLAHLAADWLGLRNIIRLTMRFEERVWPGDQLTFGGDVVRAWDEHGARHVEVALWCTNQAGRRNLSGRAVAATAAPSPGKR